MVELSLEQRTFLKRIEDANKGRSTLNGFAADFSRTIQLDPIPSSHSYVFSLTESRSRISKYGGTVRIESYHFEPEQFLPLLEQLRGEREVIINLRGVYVIQDRDWDEKHFIHNSSHAVLAKGQVEGRLRLLENDVFGEYDLRLNHKKEAVKGELSSSDGTLDKEKILYLVQTML